MSERMILVGAEQVESAARTMKHAAESIEQSVSRLDEILERHRQSMNDWLITFEQICNEATP